MEQMTAISPTKSVNAVDNGSRRTLTDILVASESDKYGRHHYERYYEKWFSPIRDDPIKFCEIGAEKGRSLKLWSDYFKNKQLILGIAYKAESEGVEERPDIKDTVTVYRGDQGKKQTMDYIKERGPWDVILDDGSHAPEHMVFSLYSLWESVKPGGMYIVEDLETNYWKRGSNIYGYPLHGGFNAGPDKSAVVKFMQLIHVLVRYQIGAEDDLSIMPGDDTICSIEWGMNLVVFRKCTAKESVNNPAKNGKIYDQAEMKKWMEEARRTNP
jgi:hypothetical protein